MVFGASRIVHIIAAIVSFLQEYRISGEYFPGYLAVGNTVHHGTCTSTCISSTGGNNQQLLLVVVLLVPVLITRTGIPVVHSVHTNYSSINHQKEFLFVTIRGIS